MSDAHSDADLLRLRRVAALARLELEPAEEARLAPELARILAAFEELARRTPAPAPAPAPLEPAARTRPDVPQPSLAPHEFLPGAPATEEGFFLVPKTIGGAP